PFVVIPAKAGVHCRAARCAQTDPGCRRDDGCMSRLTFSGGRPLLSVGRRDTSNGMILARLLRLGSLVNRSQNRGPLQSTSPTCRPWNRHVASEGTEPRHHCRPTTAEHKPAPLPLSHLTIPHDKPSKKHPQALILIDAHRSS